MNLLGANLNASAGPLWSQLSLDPIFGWSAAIVVALLMLASLWLTYSASELSRAQRTILILLRLSAIIILLLGWIRPGLVATQERESAGAIAVLMDRSESMTLPGSATGKSRWEVQRGIWSRIESATSLQIGEAKIVPYFFDARLISAGSELAPNGSQLFAQPPQGKLTDLGGALAEIGRQQVDPPLRGALVITDAMQTLVPPKVDATVAARQMAQLDQPIVMIGVGQNDTSQIRDVAVSGLPEHFSAFLKKELRVPLVVKALGVQSEPIDVELRLKASGKQDVVVAKRKVLASGPQEQLPLEFSFVVPEIGEYLLEVTATIEGREQSLANNRSVSFITVREGGVRILYLEGQLRPEQTFLKRSLDDSLDFEVDLYPILEKGRKRSWPLDLTRSISFEKYDAIIIGDLDASALSEATAVRIRSRVQQGTGLMLIGGYHSFSGGGYGRSDVFNQLIPFRMGNVSQPWGQPIDQRLHIADDVKLEPTQPHPITSLASDPLENRQIWDSLPPLQGMNRFGPLDVRPGVQVLLKSQNGDPALVTSAARRGRVLAFAGDTTWRWWLVGRQRKVHQQFWRQAMLWLVGRDTINQGFKLELDRRRLSLGESPQLEVEWFGGDEALKMPEDVKVSITRSGRWLKNAELNPTSASSLQSTIKGLDQPGLYSAELAATDDAGKSYEANVAFIVRDESLELAQPAADWQMVANIVSANSEAGGQSFLPEEVDQAIQWFRKRQAATVVTTIEKRRLGDQAWDSWLVLSLFCILLSAEWSLRKAWQLP